MCSWLVIRIGSRCTVYTYHTLNCEKNNLRSCRFLYIPWFSNMYSILQFRSKHKIKILRIFFIYFSVFVLCVINPLLIDTQKNSLLFVLFLISWPKLFKNVSIIVLCKRHDSQSFLILCLDLRKTFISVIEMQTNC